MTGPKTGGRSESPWKDYGFGKGLSTRKLAELLKPYSIRSQNVRAGAKSKVIKAYKKDSFKDAWERYLCPEACPSPTGATPQIATILANPEQVALAPAITPASKADLEPQLGDKTDLLNEPVVMVDIDEDGGVPIDSKMQLLLTSSPGVNPAMPIKVTLEGG